MVNTKIQRWAVLMAEYGAKVEYRKGKNNVRADMLSRIAEGSEMAVFEADEEWVTLEEEANQVAPRLPSEMDDLADAAMYRAQQVEFQEELDLAERNEGNYLVTNGLLYSTSNPGKGQAAYPRLMLPKQFRASTMTTCQRRL
jgi:hypothetical protein